MKYFSPLLFAAGALSMAIRADYEALVPLSQPENGQQVVPDRYIIILKKTTTLANHWTSIGRDLSKDPNVCKDFHNMENIHQYACTVTDKTVLDGVIRKDTENVLEVEHDVVVTINSGGGEIQTEVQPTK
jgi:hypothetical protein